MSDVLHAAVPICEAARRRMPPAYAGVVGAVVDAARKAMLDAGLQPNPLAVLAAFDEWMERDLDAAERAGHAEGGATFQAWAEDYAIAGRGGSK